MPKLSFQYVKQMLPETLVEFLTRRFKYHTATEWDKLISDGYVRINDKKTNSSKMLQTKDVIVYEPPPTPEPNVDPGHSVIYEDQWVLAVSKSGNIPTSPSGKYWNNCLVHVLKKKYQYPDLLAAHRLDRETSGINLFAKDKDTARVLGDSFNKGKVEKHYTAVLKGNIPSGEILITGPIAKCERSKIHIKQDVLPNGRPSQTFFYKKGNLGDASLVVAVPLTGRTHQIRLHAASIGHPVIGDKLYGQKDEYFVEWLEQGVRNSTDRQLLHASYLAFIHPETGKMIKLDDPPTGIVALYQKLI